jgi:hypothetical protein
MESLALSAVEWVDDIINYNDLVAAENWGAVAVGDPVGIACPERSRRGASPRRTFIQIAVRSCRIVTRL